ncbi:MAG TPA: hypothetical protein VEX88_06025 [Glaciibacter sp.]|nr:hypothetical protein [Glaciibacter sp.]
MTSPARGSRGSIPASAGRAVPADVLLVAVFACALALSSAAYAVPAGAATRDQFLTAPGTVRIPKQPAASQPEAVPSATSPSDETPVPPAHFDVGWLLPLGGGLAGLAALSVLMVARSQKNSDDD